MRALSAALGIVSPVALIFCGWSGLAMLLSVDSTAATWPGSTGAPPDGVGALGLPPVHAL